MEHKFEYARQTLLVEKYRLEKHRRMLADLASGGADVGCDLGAIVQRIANLDAAIFSLLPEMKLSECQVAKAVP